MPSSSEGAMLTPTHREFLRGESDADWNDSRGRTIRTRMRKRLLNGIGDFAYLAEPQLLDERDAKLLRETLRNNDPQSPGLQELIAFVYRLEPDAFESIVESGTQKGVRRTREGYSVENVRIPIKKRGRILDSARRAMENDDPLTDKQVRILLEQSDIPAEDIQQYVQEHPSSSMEGDRRRFR